MGIRNGKMGIRGWENKYKKWEHGYKWVGNSVKPRWFFVWIVVNVLKICKDGIFCTVKVV
jgi:hypothetical protein